MKRIALILMLTSLFGVPARAQITGPTRVSPPVVLPPVVAPARRLVALDLSFGSLPATLPSVEVPITADVKLGPGDDFDTIAFVDRGLRIAVNSTMPAPQRSARPVRYSKGSFETVAAVELP